MKPKKLKLIARTEEDLRVVSAIFKTQLQVVQILQI